MFVLIWSLLGLSFVHSSFGVVYYDPQNVPPFSTFQPTAYQLNQPAVSLNPPAVQFPSPVNPIFNTAQPNIQVPNSFEGWETQPPRSWDQQAQPSRSGDQQAQPSRSGDQQAQPSLSWDQQAKPSRSWDQLTPPSPSWDQQTQPSRSWDASVVPSQCQFTDVVKNFKNNFVQSISSSQRYKDAFNLQRVNKERAASIWYENIRAESVRAGEKDPDFSAFTNAQAVRDNYEFIDSDYHLKVFGFSLGEYLYQKRVLTADNVLELSEKLAQIMKDSIDENANPTSEDDLVEILKGCERFLTSLNSEDLSYADDAIFGELFYILKNCNCY